MTVPTYPKRPSNFAIKFIRRMGKVCLGNDVTPDACWLLAFIASTEDAKHYRAAVTFWNEDLATRTGLSLSGMKRAREKAIGAGWLHYEPGAKGRAARYYVTIPPWADGLDDAPGDEQPGELSGSDTGSMPVHHEPESNRNPDGIRTESGRNVDHILPVPVPVPIPAVETPAVRAPRKRTKPKAAPREKTPRPRNPLFDAICEVTGATPSANGKHVGTVVAALAGENPPYTPDEVRVFGQRFFEFCPLARGQRNRPTIGELQKQIHQVRASKNGHVPASTFNPPHLNPSKAPPDNRRKVTS